MKVHSSATSIDWRQQCSGNGFCRCTLSTDHLVCLGTSEHFMQQHILFVSCPLFCHLLCFSLEARQINSPLFLTTRPIEIYQCFIKLKHGPTSEVVNLTSCARAFRCFSIHVVLVVFLIYLMD